MTRFKSFLALCLVGIAFNTMAETTQPFSAVKERGVKSGSEMKTMATNVGVSDLQNTIDAKRAEGKAAIEKSQRAVTKNVEEKPEQVKATVQKNVVEKTTEVKAVTAKKVDKININKADAKTLQNLSGIGEAKAQAIIDYRNQHGKIKNIKELAHVSGIGESTLEKIKPFIRF